MSENYIEPTFLDQSIMNWFYDNKQLSKYIEISSLNDQKDNESILQILGQMEMNRQKQIIRLSQFYNSALSTVYEEAQKKPVFIQPSSNLSFMNAHILYYVQLKMKKMKKENIENSMKLTNKLLELIKNPEFTLQKVDINFDESNFFREMLLDTPNYLRLDSYSRELTKNLKNDYQINFTNEILDILNRASVQVDKTSYYFRENQLQERFDSIIFNPLFPLYEEIDTFCNALGQIPRSVFTKKVISIFQLLINYLDQSLNQLQNSCCFIFIFRSLFSYAYSKNPEYFYPKFDLETDTDVQKIAHKVPCSFLSIPDNSLPDHQPDDKIIDVFRKNEYFTRGSNHLDFAAMVLNPIDAIYEVHEMMMCNQCGLAVGNKNQEFPIFSFETTFGLYISSVLSSDLPNFIQLARFINDFTPTYGLCPEFEFAATTTRAALEFCSILVSKFKD